MTIVQKFDVKIAKLDRSDIFRNQGHGVNQIINLAEQFRAPNLSLSLSMGKRRGSLYTEGIVDAIRRCLRISTDYDKTINKIEVTGREDESSPKEILDILKYSMIEKVNVRLNNERRLPYANRLAALYEAWNRREGELNEMFSPRRR